MATTQDERRQGRLRHVFRDILSGTRQVRTSQDAQLFLEATRVHQPANKCVEMIMGSKYGLDAVRDAVRSNLSAAFVLSSTLPFLHHVSDPGVKTLADGQLLQDILFAVAKPSTLWNALVKMFNGNQVPDDKLYPFAWLSLELISLPSNTGMDDILQDVKAISESNVLVKSDCHEVREVGYKIKKVLQIRLCSPRHGNLNGNNHAVGGPGGRHDNDHAHFRDILIYPTTDEFLSTQTPFYRTAKEVSETPLENRAQVHLDNQFRLLREDMLAELREDLQVAMGTKKGRKPVLKLGKLDPIGVDTGDQATGRYKKCTLMVCCYEGFPHALQHPEVEKRKRWLKNETSFLRHQSFGVLCRGKEVFGCAFVDRDIDLLAQMPPVVSLQFTDCHGLRAALLSFASPNAADVKFIPIDTPVFAYEPVLAALQTKMDLPLQDIIVNPKGANPSHLKLPARLDAIGEKIRSGIRNMVPDGSMKVRVETGKEVELDSTQASGLLNALTQPLSLIQGPPGTGKTFVGAYIAKCLHMAGRRILVISYTNHALNDFSEHLLDVGIPPDDMVRLGSHTKCTPRTLPLLLSVQERTYKQSQTTWDVIKTLKDKAKEASIELHKAFDSCKNVATKWNNFYEYLEFSDFEFHQAFTVPTEIDSRGGQWQRAGKKGRQVGPDYLFQRWIRGEDPGVFKNDRNVAFSRAVWAMPHLERQNQVSKWTRAMVEEGLGTVEELARQFNETQDKIDTQFRESSAHTMRQKKVIGCTTTAAAKYSHLIRAAKPDVVLVEEAGEILESHVLTSLASTVQQLVLIGDHLQLRPKINNYNLSVEKGEGYDLNCSLFERLIKQGAPHTTLRKQHRMVPEISLFPRELTYPDLLDGPKTHGRPAIRGLQDRVVFVNHTNAEDNDLQLHDRRDPGTKQSKRNAFEAEMAIRCVKFFGQQGYAADQIVVLTPYLGQLRVLQDELRKYQQYDPALSEMDKMDLIRAGLITEAAAKVTKTPLRISTIDNYQGEESDIVIASLTRSNKNADIGFMFAPERLNVLITRARNCLVLIGDMETFMRSKKGGPAWRPFFELMKTHGHLYDGLPVKCEKHPERKAVLKEPIDFDKSCPDGGCTEPCDALLKCGIHKCKSRCHRVTDHTRAECHQLIEKICDRKHKIKVQCSKRNNDCRECIREDKKEEERIKRDLKLEEDRLRQQEAYQRQLKELDDEIEHQRRINKYKQDEKEQKNTLEQRKNELEQLKETQAKIEKQKRMQEELKTAMEKKRADAKNKKGDQKPDSNGGDSGNLLSSIETAEGEWAYLKEYENAQSKPMDDLMAMIGLEDVKQEFLAIKSKVDTAVRQSISLSSERFSCSMLGNPGTGKTTVARLYAKFLTEVGAIPGNCFKENTGAGLANLGVNGCKKLIDDILAEGGGVFFVDEAYQLSSGNNPGGGAVLDYLLAEVENLCGKVVFVLAGYNKQMESFFAHNPGLPSRFPIDMKFADYTDEELLRILELKINNRYNDLMQVEDGLRGLYCRIVASRIGRGRGSEGFGNARSVENVLSTISKRQANRLRKERRKQGSKPDDLFLTKEDLIGPEPAGALSKCAAWKKLQSLTGLASVKEAVKALVDSIQQNYKRELAEEPPIQYSLNKVFLGNPGTGKTTVAKLYGEILVALGLLSKGEVIVKNPADFVGAALGQSEQQTKGILASATGKVLVIDEAYGLYGGSGSTSDPYKTAVIDTIVAEVQSVPGDDRCVLLLGYKAQMEEMFQNVNPGLSRRFPIASGFEFADFSDKELQEIFNFKLKGQGYQTNAQGRAVVMEMLQRAKNRPNFGNAGEIDIILDRTKARHQRRFTKEAAAGGRGQKPNNLLEPQDFDENFDRAQRSETNVRKLFEGTVGSDQVVTMLEEYQETVRTFKELEMDPKENIPFNFLFRGPPGTGKTTTARKMGQVFYDMGFLATPEVVECSSADMVAQYVGQTAPKVLSLLDKALGRVLFIDEAYRLAEGHFAQEAVDSLVDAVTKERYHKKLVIILAGYENDINRLMSVNTGLSSRFPDVIDFHSLNPEECVALLLNLLNRQKYGLKTRGKELDLACLERPTRDFKSSLLRSFADLIVQDNWASARDVQNLNKKIYNKLLRRKEQLARGTLILDQPLVKEELQAMFNERASRAKASSSAAAHKSVEDTLRDMFPSPQAAPPPQAPVMSTSTAIETRTETAEVPPPVEEEEDVDDAEPQPQVPQLTSKWDHLRDAGVSDAVWNQLVADRLAEERREAEYQKLVEEAKKASAAAREKIVRRLLEEERKRKMEEEMRKKLAANGVCPMGFDWIKQDNGYRCAGGSHFMSNEELEKLSK